MKKGVDHIGITCVFYCHDGNGNFLLHKRSENCRDEKGKWDCGGGALHFGEDFETAVRREIKEEYCVEPENLQFITASNVLRGQEGENTHWIALIFAAQVDPEKVQIGEPHKLDEIGWFRKGEFPTPLHSQLLRHFKHIEDAGIA